MLDHRRWEYVTIYNSYKEAIDTYKELVKKNTKEEFDKKLYAGEKFICTEVVAGEKCNDGGEYGFYKIYSPTTLFGIYRVDSSCTCDFDKCGTGFEGYIIMTKYLYNYLISESDRIESEGSLY